MDLQRDLPPRERLSLYKREFWCPVCRQLCNIVLLIVDSPARITKESLHPYFGIIFNRFMDDEDETEVNSTFEKIFKN